MPDAPADDFAALVESLSLVQSRRRPLEERLRAIEERRNSTPPAVYERVRRETIEKLMALEADAAGLMVAAEKARARAAEQQADLGPDLDRAVEALEEVRFRNSLGEYSAEQFQHAEAEATSLADGLRAQLQQLAEYESVIAAFLSPPAPRPKSDPALAAARMPEAVPSDPLLPATAREAPARSDPALAAPARSGASTGPSPELESLFGAMPPPPPRRSDLAPPPPPVSEAGAAAAVAPAAPRDRTTTSESVAPSSLRRGEEPTEDVRPRASDVVAGSRAPVSVAAPGVFRPTIIVKTKDKDRGEDSYELANGATLLGRAPENDIILLEESVSRRHARLLVENGAVTFEDLGSANGSFINGERLQPKSPQRLQDNDVIKMGQLLALFRINPDD